MGTFLAQEDERGRERAIYYFSRVLTEVERRYLPMEKLCLAYGGYQATTLYDGTCGSHYKRSQFSSVHVASASLKWTFRPMGLGFI